jgi:hypothetical protein
VILVKISLGVLSSITYIMLWWHFNFSLKYFFYIYCSSVYLWSLYIFEGMHSKIRVDVSWCICGDTWSLINYSFTLLHYRILFTITWLRKNLKEYRNTTLTILVSKIVLVPHQSLIINDFLLILKYFIICDDVSNYQFHWVHLLWCL